MIDLPHALGILFLGIFAASWSKIIQLYVAVPGTSAGFKLGVRFFFCSFHFISSILLLSLIVALVWEAFVALGGEGEAKQKKKREEKEEQARREAKRKMLHSASLAGSSRSSAFYENSFSNDPERRHTLKRKGSIANIANILKRRRQSGKVTAENAAL